MKVVLKLGGLIFDSELSSGKIEGYAKAIKELCKTNKLIIVTGGGPVSRKYISAARELGASEAICDQIGIHVSRVNARLLVAALGDSAFPEIPESLGAMRTCAATGLIVVMGGLQPGQSTNAAAALAAEITRADLVVNATDVDGVYTADPQKDPNAKKLDEVTPDELAAILSQEGFRGGEYALVDPLAIRIIKRSGIPVILVNGRDAKNVVKAIQGKRIGTRIVPHKK